MVMNYEEFKKLGASSWKRYENDGEVYYKSGSKYIQGYEYDNYLKQYDADKKKTSTESSSTKSSSASTTPSIQATKVDQLGTKNFDTYNTSKAEYKTYKNTALQEQLTKQKADAAAQAKAVKEAVSTKLSISGVSQISSAVKSAPVFTQMKKALAAQENTYNKALAKLEKQTAAQTKAAEATRKNYEKLLKQEQARVAKEAAKEKAAQAKALEAQKKAAAQAKQAELKTKNINLGVEKTNQLANKNMMKDVSLSLDKNYSQGLLSRNVSNLNTTQTITPTGG